MKLSVFTASTPEWTPQQAATILAKQGWDGIEWRVTDQEDSTSPGFWAGNLATWPATNVLSRIDDIERTTRESGLEYSGIGGYAMVADRDAVEESLQLTAALGAARVRLRIPAARGDYSAVFMKTRADLEWAAGRASHHNVQVLIELHHQTISASASAARRLIDGLDPRHVGVIHDIGNLIREGFEDYLSAFQILGPYLAHIHVKNAEWLRNDPVRAEPASWRIEWASFSTGVANFDEYFQALFTVGYDGWVTSEDFSTDLPLEERTAGNLAFLRGTIDRILQRG